MKAKDIIPPLVIVGAIGIIAYALLSHPAGASSSLPGTFNPNLGVITPSSPVSTSTTAYNPGSSLQMPGSGQGATTTNFNIPAFAVPAMTMNNISGSACGGCGNF